LKDKISNPEVVILYVNDFEYKFDDELYSKHPQPGRIYRAVKFFSIPESKTVYHLIFEEDGKVENRGVFVYDLVFEYPDFKCELLELSDDNVGELSLSMEDYKNLELWGDDYENGLARHLERFKLLANLPMIGEEETPKEDFEEYAEQLPANVLDTLRNSTQYNPEEVHLALRALNGYDMRSFENLMALARHLNVEYLNRPDVDHSREFLESDGDGKIATWVAFEKIQSYQQALKEGEPTPIYLLEAMEYLIYELNRVTTYE
jgi:hypothetical protein